MHDLFDLRGRTALVTGATASLGIVTRAAQVTCGAPTSGEPPRSCRLRAAGAGRLPVATNGCLGNAKREGPGLNVGQLLGKSTDHAGSVCGLLPVLLTPT
jgi:hypothetical protein